MPFWKLVLVGLLMLTTQLVTNSPLLGKETDNGGSLNLAGGNTLKWHGSDASKQRNNTIINNNHIQITKKLSIRDMTKSLYELHEENYGMDEQ